MSCLDLECICSGSRLCSCVCVCVYVFVRVRVRVRVRVSVCVCVRTLWIKAPGFEFPPSPPWGLFTLGGIERGLQKPASDSQPGSWGFGHPPSARRGAGAGSCVTAPPTQFEPHFSSLQFSDPSPRPTPGGGTSAYSRPYCSRCVYGRAAI